MLTLKVLLEETMDTKQKLQDRVKYLEKKCTKGKTKIMFKDESIDISNNDNNEGDKPATRTTEPIPSMLAYEQATGII